MTPEFKKRVGDLAKVQRNCRDNNTLQNDISEELLELSLFAYNEKLKGSSSGVLDGSILTRKWIKSLTFQHVQIVRPARALLSLVKYSSDDPGLFPSCGEVVHS